MPLYLTEADVESLLAPTDALAAIEACFDRMARGDVDNRPRFRHRLEEASFAVMSAADHDLQRAGIKSYVASAKGARFVVALFDTAKAELVAVIEADKLGQLRTGAASGVAAKHLAKPEATTLGVIGCGWQAESQVASIREAVPSVERVVAYCRTEKSLKRFCRKLKAEPGESHRDPAAQDIVVTATTSADPVVRGEWLQSGALVCAMGANVPHHRELDNVVLERAAFVCCDSLENAKLESGDLIEPVEQGILDWLEVHELQEVVAREITGRASPEDIVVFKSNGLAAWDVAVATRAVELARERGVGTEL